MDYTKALIAFAAAWSVTVGIVTGIGEAKVAERAVESVCKNPEATNEIRTTMIVGSAISETCAIYGLLVAILLIFVY